MSLSEVRVRRATVDDLPKLTTLWDSMNLIVADLEKRLTEFQIVESAEGDLLGGIGIQIIGRHARLHSEGFADFSIADHVRPKLWERIQSVAQNHGLVRLWTQETAPFWKQTGFQTASPETLAKLPPTWTQPDSQWLTQQLKDEQVVELDIDKEFSQFMQSEKQKSFTIMRQAQVMKQVGTVIALIFAAFVVVVLIFMLKNHISLSRH